MTVVVLMASLLGQHGGARHAHVAPAVFAFASSPRVPRHGAGDDRGGLLRSGDDNAQSVFELSVIEADPRHQAGIQKGAWASR